MNKGASISKVTASTKQRRCIQIIVEEPTLRAAENRCIREKACSHVTFWKWLREESFQVELETAQKSALGDVLDEIREQAKKDAPEIYAHLQDCARNGGEPNQVQACKALMLLAGAQEFATNSKINIGVSANATVHSAEQADDAFVDRARAAARARGVVDFTPSEN